MILCAFCPAIIVLVRAFILFLSYTSVPRYAYIIFSTIFFAVLYYYNYKKTKDKFIKIENNSAHNVRNLLIIPIVLIVLSAFDSLICAPSVKVFLVFSAPFFVISLIYAIINFIIQITKPKKLTSAFYALFLTFQTILAIYLALFMTLTINHLYFSITLMNAYSLMCFSFVSFKDIQEYEQMLGDIDETDSLNSFSWKFSTIFGIVLLILSSVTLLYFFLR